MEMQHRTHRHPLVLLEIDDHRKGWGCRACDSGLHYPDPAPLFGCQECQFYLHKRCAELPQQIWHPLHPGTPLLIHFFKMDSPIRIHKCRLCNQFMYGHEEPSTLIYYKCDKTCSNGCSEAGEFRIAMDCALLKPSWNHPHHQHPLVSIKEFSRSVICAACGIDIKCGKEGADLYRCLECDVRFHMECFDIPSEIEIDEYHHHPLLISTEPIPEDYDENPYYCDVCETERNVRAFSYACKECNYVSHLQCDVFQRGFKNITEDLKEQLVVEEVELQSIQKEIQKQEEILHELIGKRSVREGNIKKLKDKIDRRS